MNKTPLKWTEAGWTGVEPPPPIEVRIRIDTDLLVTDLCAALDSTPETLDPKDVMRFSEWAYDLLVERGYWKARRPDPVKTVADAVERHGLNGSLASGGFPAIAVQALREAGYDL